MDSVWIVHENKDAPDNQYIYAYFRIADQSGVGISVYNDKMEIQDKRVLRPHLPIISS